MRLDSTAPREIHFEQRYMVPAHTVRPGSASSPGACARLGLPSRPGAVRILTATGEFAITIGPGRRRNPYRSALSGRSRFFRDCR